MKRWWLLKNGEKVDEDTIIAVIDNEWTNVLSTALLV